jgi:ankyrin repeat protein
MNSKDISLILAAKEGYLETVVFLLENGADLHTQSDRPLLEAVLNNHTEIADYLLEKGANIKFKTIEKVIDNHIPGQPLDSLELLLKYINVEVQQNYFIGIATRNNQIPIVELLLEYGADIRDNEDFPLFYAVQEGFERMTIFLIENGASIHSRNNSILSFAVQKNLPARERGNSILKIFQYLLRYQFPRSVITRALSKVTDSEDYKDLEFRKMLKEYLVDNIRPVYELSENLKNSIKRREFKWQDICSRLNKEGKESLKNYGKLLGLDVNDKSKRELCKLISEEMLLLDGTCEDSNLSGDSLIELPKWRIFKIKGKCYDILDLKEILDSGETRNPYTREDLPVGDIKARLNMLTNLSIRNRLESETFIERVKINPLVDVNQLVIRLFGTFPYMIDPSIITKATDSEIDELSLELFIGKANNMFRVKTETSSKILEASGNKKKRLFIELLLKLKENSQLFQLIYFAFSYFDKKKKGENVKDDLYLSMINQ